MNVKKVENLKKYIKDFYKCDVAFIEEDCLLIKVIMFNSEHKKAWKLTCMEELEKYKEIGVEDIDYSCTFIL